LCGETMTGIAFIKRLSFQLDFLSDHDKKIVIDFYQNKLRAASTITEEEAIVKTFGSPEHVAAKLKEAFDAQMKNTSASSQENIQKESESEPVPQMSEEPEDVPGPESSDTEENLSLSQEQEEKRVLSEDPASAPNLESMESEVASDAKGPNEAPSDTENEFPLTDTSPLSAQEEIAEETSDEKDLEDSLIFSKPPVIEKAPEVIHSLENKEVKTLYGEKVTIANRTEPIEEFVLEDGDFENGFTPEEIELAKAETLEKAKNYHTDSILSLDAESDASTQSNQEDQDPPLSENDWEDDGAFTQAETDAQKKHFVGVFEKMFENTSLPKGARIAITVLLSLILSPVLLLLCGVGVGLYAGITALILVFSVLLFILIAVFIVGSVIELVHGIVLLFDTVSVALIEIGVGTVLFSFVLAFAAISYEFLFALLPKALRALTKLCARYLRLLFAFLYGGVA